MRTVEEVRESRERHYIITGKHYKSEKGEKKRNQRKGAEKIIQVY
jgi:hypothetical protein